MAMSLNLHKCISASGFVCVRVRAASGFVRVRVRVRVCQDLAH
jgi:hypothetical protein